MIRFRGVERRGSASARAVVGVVAAIAIVAAVLWALNGEGATQTAAPSTPVERGADTAHVGLQPIEPPDPPTAQIAAKPTASSEPIEAEFPPSAAPPRVSLLTADPPTTTTPVHGRVVDLAGVGIADATVVMHATTAFEHESAPQGDSSGPLAEVLTDDDGRFLFDPGPLAHVVELVAAREGYISAGSVSFSHSRSEVTIILARPTAVVFGKVVRQDDSPAEGAVVRGWRRQSSQLRMVRRHVAEAIVGSDGSYRLEGLGEGPCVVTAGPSLAAIDGNGPTTEEEFSLTSGEEHEHDIVLPTRVQISGRVLDVDSGLGVAGVSIGHKYRLADEKWLAVSDASGHFVLKDLDLREMDFYYSLAVPSGYVQVAEGVGSIDQLEIPDLAQPPPLEIKLRRGVALPVQVLQPDGATAAADVEVTIERLRSRTRIPTVRTDASGRATFSAPMDELLWVSAEDSTGTAGQEVTIPAGSTPGEMRLVLQPWASVSGRARNERGEGLAGLSIVAGVRRAGGRMTALISGADTDERGYFELQRLPPGPLMIQMGYGNPFAPILEEINRLYLVPDPVAVELKAGEARPGVDLVFLDALAFEGFVVDEAGNPVAEADVQPEVQSNNPRPLAIKTDAKGYFRIVGFREGTVINSFRVSAVGYDRKVDQPRNVALEASPVTIVMIKHARQGVRILYPNGSPVTNFAWRQLLTNHEFTFASTPWTKVNDPDGMLTTTGTEGLDFEVFDVTADGQPGDLCAVAQLTREQLSAPTPPEVRLGRAGSIRGTVQITGSATPIAGVAVDTNGTFEEWGSAWKPPVDQGLFTPATITSDANGAFTLAKLTPRRHALRAIHPDYQMVFEGTGVEVRAGEETGPVTINMTPPGVLTGIVIGRDGKPAVGASVELRYQGQSAQSQRLATDAAGRFELRPAHYGGYYYVATILEPVELTYYSSTKLQQGDDSDLVIDFTGVVRLTGIVTQGGKPYTGSASLTARFRGDAASDSRFRLVSIQPRAQGQYTAYVLPGAYQLEGTPAPQGFRPPESTALTDFDVSPEPPEQTRDFELDLSTVTVALVFPTDADFAPGTVVLSRSVTETISHAAPPTARATRADVPFPEVFAGTYIATFRSDDGLWQGSSEPVRVGTGADNILAIDLPSPAGRRVIGNWQEMQPSSSLKRLEFDATGAIAAGSRLTVGFDQTEGNGGLAITAVALLINGTEVSRDDHSGRTGTAPRAHLYRLSVGGVPPNARVTLVARALPMGPSSGQVWVQGGR